MHYLLSYRRKLVYCVAALIVIVGAVYGYTVYQFDHAFNAYVAAANGQDTAALIPGAPDNATRLILNRLLSEILTQQLTNEERIRRANEGLDALEVSELEIDAIGFMGENVTNTMSVLASRFTLLHVGDTRDILTLAHERLEIAADIRGLSYLANHHIAAIFNRILSDGGVVTPEHTVELNRKIPEVEADFDRRAKLYRDLASLAFRINQEAASISW